MTTMNFYKIGIALFILSTVAFLTVVAISYYNKKWYNRVCDLYEKEFGLHSLPLNVAILKDADFIGFNNGYAIKMQFIFNPLIHNKKSIYSNYNDVEFFHSLDPKIKNTFKFEYYLFSTFSVSFILSVFIFSYEKAIGYFFLEIKERNLTPTEIIIISTFSTLWLSIVIKLILSKFNKFRFIKICEKYESKFGVLPREVKRYIETTVVSYMEFTLIKINFIVKPLFYGKKLRKKNSDHVEFMKNLAPNIKRWFIIEYFMDVLMVLSLLVFLITLFVKFKLSI